MKPTRAEERLRERLGSDDGMRVPDGYFAQTWQQLSERLPERKAAPRPVRLSRWQQLRPYLYLAAMFAGIWCMMKIFHTVATPERLSLDQAPVALAMAADEGIYTERPYDAYSDYELIEDLSTQYDDMAHFQADFDNLETEAQTAEEALTLETASEAYMASHP